MNIRHRTRTQHTTLKVINALLSDECTTAPQIIERTGLQMTTVYSALRRMVIDGWLIRSPVPGTCRRDYAVTDAGRRAMHFLLALADQGSAEDSRSSSPTAARSSS